MENNRPPWVLIAGLVIGLLTLLFFMALVVTAIFGHEVPCNSRFLVAVILALGVALSAAFLGGQVAAEGKIPVPFVKDHPVVFGATGGIAALVIVLLLGNWLYSERNCGKDDVLSQHINSMLTNLNAKQYDGALAKAADVLQIDPKNFRALNVMGTVAFYRRQYSDAVKYFGQALQVKPGDKLIAKNLADSYVEIEAYDLAIKTYLDARTDTADWHYSTGRAYVFAGKYDEGLSYLQAVKEELYENAPEVVRAAAYIGKSLVEAEQKTKGRLLDQAKSSLSRACMKNSLHWNQILSQGKKAEYETYEKIIPLLEKLYVAGKACS